MYRLERPLVLLSVAAIVAFSTLIFPLLLHAGPDVFHHLNLIRCFAEQLWDGNVYPRWCDSLNAGLGSQIFINYYPGAYYITSLFWPLKWLGMDPLYTLALSAWLSGVVAFIAVFYWLRELAGDKVAAVCALFYLWLPYRMEVLALRPSLPELWAIAFYPFIFLYVRRLAAGMWSVLPALTLVIALALLTQIPTTLCIIFLAGIYLAIISWPSIKPCMAYVLANALALLMVLFYIAPAKYYDQFLTNLMQRTLDKIWVCRHMQLIDITERPAAVAGFLVTLIAFLAFITIVYRRRKWIADKYILRHTLAMALVGGIACFMLFPPSAFIWDIWRQAGAPGMPWRMQIGVGMALIFMLAIYASQLMTEKRKKTKTGDVAVTFILIGLISLSYTADYAAESKPILQRMAAARVMQFDEHFSRWTDTKHSEIESIVELYEKHPDRPLAMIPIDVGEIIETVRKQNNISVKYTAKKDTQIVIEHFYYPSWRAQDEAGSELHLEPIQDTGRMKVSVPSGTHSVQLFVDIYRGSWLLEWCRQISAAGLLLWSVLYWRSRKATFSKA